MYIQVLPVAHPYKQIAKHELTVFRREKEKKNNVKATLAGEKKIIPNKIFKRMTAFPP